MYRFHQVLLQNIMSKKICSLYRNNVLHKFQPEERKSLYYITVCRYIELDKGVDRKHIRWTLFKYHAFLPIVTV